MKPHGTSRLGQLPPRKGPFPVKGPIPQLPDVDAPPHEGQETVATSHHYVSKTSHMEDRHREQFRKSVRTLFANMSEAQVDAYIEEGFRLDAGALRAATFVEKSRAQPDRPLLYSERPPSMKLVEFLRHEYLQKGVLAREGFNRLSIRAIDEPLYQAIKDFCRTAELPPDIDIAKARKRLNKREAMKARGKTLRP